MLVCLVLGTVAAVIAITKDTVTLGHSCADWYRRRKNKVK
jgi:hypothetical protein